MSPMNEDTRFILKRMDALEGRLMDELKEIQAWRNRVIGMAIVAGGVGSVLVEMAIKHF